MKFFFGTKKKIYFGKGCFLLNQISSYFYHILFVVAFSLNFELKKNLHF